MATAKGSGEVVLERSASPCSDEQKGLEFHLDKHGYPRNHAHRLAGVGGGREHFKKGGDQGDKIFTPPPDA